MCIIDLCKRHEIYLHSYFCQVFVPPNTFTVSLCSQLSSQYFSKSTARHCAEEERAMAPFRDIPLPHCSSIGRWKHSWRYMQIYLWISFSCDEKLLSVTENWLLTIFVHSCHTKSLCALFKIIPSSQLEAHDVEAHDVEAPRVHEIM